MELASKVIAPKNVESGSGSLPASDTQSVREAIQSAHPSGSGTDITTHAPLDKGGAGQSLAPLPTVQILITIIPKVTIAPALPPLPGRGGATTTDALVDAILRLSGHGVFITTDDKGIQFSPGTTAQRGHYQPQSSHREPRHRPDYRSPEVRRDPQSAEGQQRDDRPTRDHGERTQREDARPSRPETPAEERIREVLERAIARYQERFGEVTTNPERPTPPVTPEKIEPQRPGTLPAPTIDPERLPRAPESIVTPIIREALTDPRNDTARLIQQLLGNDPAPSRPHTPTPSETNPSQTINAPLAEARAGVNERLTQLRDALQVTMERSSPQPLTSPERHALISQGAANQGDFTRVEPTVHAARPTTNVQSEGRSTPDTVRLPTFHTDPTTPLSSGVPAHTGFIRPAGQPRDDVTVATHEKASNLLEALSKAAQKILSVNSLRKLETAAETAVITAAAAIALGVMGSEIVLKEILALSEELLRRLRGEKAGGENGEKEIIKLEQLIRELEEECADRGVETINQPAGLVADIPGTIKDDCTGAPLEGIEVDGGPLGITYTDALGNFSFANVPLEEGFTIVARNIHYSFFPCPAIGTVSTATYLTIVGKRTQ